MLRFSQLYVVVFSTAGLLACNARQAPPAVSAPESALPSARLEGLIEHYWAERFTRAPFFAPDISAQALADSLAAERRYLTEVAAVPRTELPPHARLTYDIFIRDRQVTIEGFTYPSELLPVNPYESEPQRFALLAGSERIEDWQGAADDFARWSAQAIANMREGVRRGYTMPRSTAEQTLPWLAALGTESDSNPFAKNPAKPKILSAYRALHDFLEQEYLPRARSSVGLSALPLGESWYAYVVKRETGSDSSPQATHDAGVAEVERLRARMQALLADTPYAGNLAAFAENMRRESRTSGQGPDASLTAYEELKGQVAQARPSVVAEVPKADFKILPVAVYAQTFMPELTYSPAAPGSKALGILYMNSAALDAHPASEPAAFLREALPGRHLQLAMQEERQDLPKYRRFLGSPAFIEGWEIYAVSLGDELGVYRDSGAKFGALLIEMECASTLVVDTGLHALRWSRQQALDYLHAQLPIDEAQQAMLVDAAIAVPGHRLGCASSLKFHALRVQAEKYLGSRFNLEAFHSAVLEEGAIPMDLLESQMKHWQENQAALATPVAASPGAASSPATAPAGVPGTNVR